jgi:heme exporter protein A
MNSLLILHKVLFRYQHQLIFYNLNCSLTQGSVLIIKGENGTGKSTFVRCILKLLKITSGNFYRDYFFNKVHFLYPQSSLYFTSLTLYRNLGFWNIFLNKISSLDYNLIFKLMFLFKQRSLPIQWLSLGQLRRLLLSTFLTISKPIWILDEPLIGLDFKSIELFQRILQNHRKHGGVLLIISHTNFVLVRGSSLHL